VRKTKKTKENKKPQSSLYAKKPISSIITPTSQTDKKKGSKSQGITKKKRRYSPYDRRRSHLFEKRPRNFGIGNDIQPKRDLSRFVRWPKVVKLQRQKRVLSKRLKVPPVINQFSNTIDKNTATQVLALCEKYKPESPQQKKARLARRARRIAKAKTPEEKTKALAPLSKRFSVKAGIKHVTSLIEYKKAKLVVIAHDVDPIEIVLWLPTLCKKKGIPYLIIKGKSRLGKVVNKKTCAVLAFTEVTPKHKKDLDNLCTKGTELYLNKYADIMKTEGGGVMGTRHYAHIQKEKRRHEREQKKKE